MNNKLFMKGKALPATLFCTALVLAPLTGASSAKAITAVAQQQTGTLKGTVIDSNGEPVIGASVIIVGKNANQGTITDMDGNFTLNVKPGSKLKISYIGFETQTVTAKSGMRVTMKDDNATNLNAVEVVAYGVQKKVTVTGALSSIKSEDLTRTPVGNVNNVLGGALSGVTTVQYSGEPGADAADVFVRGRATFDDNGAKPLIQVDGVERSMNDVDPDEIESITVLKDASATAVFGVQGANGVILITTKRGQEGKAKITGSTSWGILTPTKMVEQANSYEYATFHNLMSELDGRKPRFSAGVIQKFKDGSDPIRFPSTQWAKYIMKDATLQTKHNLNISGGNKFAKYFFNVGYYTQGGLFEQFGQPYDFDFRYKRFNYRANLDLNVTKTTSISINIAGNVGTTNKPYSGQGTSALIKAAYQATPFSSPGIIDGRYITASTSYDDCGDDQLPFLGGSGITYFGNASVQGGFAQHTVNKLQFDLSLKQKLDFVTKGLSFRIKGSYNGQYDIEKDGYAKKATYEPVLQEDGSFLYRKSGNEEQLTYTRSAGRARNWYFETGLDYNRKFGLHSIGGLVLYNQKSQYYYGDIYNNIPHRMVGLVGRVTYDWNNRYMAEFNLGYNGSENFAEGRRFGFFPAVSAGWVVSDEPFFKPLNKVVSFMKLRASYGLVGNDNVGVRFLYTPNPYNVTAGGVAAQRTWGNGKGYFFGLDSGGTTWGGAYESALHNDKVTWEHAYKQDYGVDIKFLKDRLSASFDYYYEHRTDILINDNTAPTMIGFTMPKVNQGEVNSWGWELSMKWQDKIGKNFRYWAGFNLSHNDNEIVEQLEKPQPYDYMMNKSHRLKSRSLYKFWRFYDEDTPALYEKTFGQPFPKQINGVALKPGDAVYVDLNGDGVIDGNDVSQEVAKATDEPRYMIGINLGFRWKDLTFNTQWTGAWDVSRLLVGNFRKPFVGNKTEEEGGLLSYVMDHSWTPDNPSQDAEYPRPTWDRASNNYASSTLFEKDSKYLRLKTLQIAYDFHFPLMKKMGMNQLQLALSGYNLLTFTPYLWGDPEAKADDNPTYPLQRTYTLTLKVGF